MKAKALNILNLEKENIWVHDLGKFLFLEGSEHLPEPQEDVYASLADNSVTCTVITNLYDKPEQIFALKYLEFDSIVLGTTGVKWKKLDELKVAFKSIGKMPKNIIFAMGEEFFMDFITDEMKTFKIYPVGWRDTPIEIHQFKS